MRAGRIVLLLLSLALSSSGASAMSLSASQPACCRRSHSSHSSRTRSYHRRSYRPRTHAPRTYRSPRVSHPRTHHSHTYHYHPRTSTRRAPHARTPRARVPHAPGARNSRGRLRRSAEAKDQFMRQTGHAHGWPDHVVDHIVPLACGGADAPSNMQWQTTQEAKAKDRIERRGCARSR